MAVRVSRMVKALPCDGCGKTATAYIMAVREAAGGDSSGGDGPPASNRTMRLCDDCGGQTGADLREITTAV
jgi:hypothetical protein